jgi:hypothetical protein
MVAERAGLRATGHASSLERRPAGRVGFELPVPGRLLRMHPQPAGSGLLEGKPSPRNRRHSWSQVVTLPLKRHSV